MKNIIFLAPPAAGKGTCSDILKNTYDCKHISTGAILRSEIASQSSLGKEIKKIRILKKIKEINEESEVVKNILNLYTKNNKIKDIYNIKKYKKVN